MTEAMTRLFFALDVQRLNIILFPISIRLFTFLVSHYFQGRKLAPSRAFGGEDGHVDLRLLLQGLRGTLEPERDLERGCTT